MLSDLALTYAKSFLLVPYIWGGQSPVGVDCSGYVIMVLQAEGTLPNSFDATSQGLYTYFKTNGAKSLPYATRGCLVFYGRSISKITHVALCYNSTHVLEAAGGDSTTKTTTDAVKRAAHVRVRKIDYRKDIVAIVTTDINNVLPFSGRTK